VKKRFQNLPFKFNLQRYNVGTQGQRAAFLQNCADGKAKTQSEDHNQQFLSDRRTRRGHEAQAAAANGDRKLLDPAPRREKVKRRTTLIVYTKQY
jgi:hypothetical protein